MTGVPCSPNATAECLRTLPRQVESLKPDSPAVNFPRHVGQRWCSPEGVVRPLLVVRDQPILRGLLHRLGGFEDGDVEDPGAVRLFEAFDERILVGIPGRDETQIDLPVPGPIDEGMLGTSRSSPTPRSATRGTRSCGGTWRVRRDRERRHFGNGCRVAAVRARSNARNPGGQPAGGPGRPGGGASAAARCGAASATQSVWCLTRFPLRSRSTGHIPRLARLWRASRSPRIPLR